MYEKGLKLDTTSLTHPVKRIIMLIIIMFVCVVILHQKKKPPDLSGGFLNMLYIFYSVPSADVIITFAIRIEGIIEKFLIVVFNFETNVFK